MVGWLVPVLLLVAPPRVSVATGSPCAPTELLTRELHRLGVQVVPSGELVVLLVPNGEEVELSLSREGRVVVRRTLRGTCEEAGSAAAVVIERYLMALGRLPMPDAGPASGLAPRPASDSPRPRPHRPPAPPSDPPDETPLAPEVIDAGSPPPSTPPIPFEPRPPPSLPPPEPSPRPAPVRVAQPEPRSLPPVEAPPKTPPAEARPSVDAGVSATPTPVPTPTFLPPSDAGPEVGLDAGLPTAPAAPELAFDTLVSGGVMLPEPFALATPVVSLEPRLFLGRWRVSVLGLFNFGGTESLIQGAVLRGTLTVREVLALPSFGVCTLTTWSLCGSVAAGARLVLAEASGPFIFQSNPKTAPQFVAAAGIDLTWHVGPVRLWLGLSALLNPVPSPVTVDGLPVSVSTPLVEGLVRGGVGLGTGRAFP